MRDAIVHTSGLPTPQPTVDNSEKATGPDMSEHQTSTCHTVDVQNGFITEHSQPVIPVITDLVQRWQAAQGDIIFSRYLNYPVAHSNDSSLEPK